MLYIRKSIFVRENLVHIFLISIIAVPLALLFYGELESLPTIVRILVTAGAIGIFSFVWYLIAYEYGHLGAKQLAIIVLSAGVGILLCSKVPNVRQSSGLLAVSKMLLAGWAFSSIALFCIYFWKNLSVSKNLTHLFRHLMGWWPIAFFLLLILSLAYLYQTKSSMIYFWDYRTYWSKVEMFYDSLHVGNWKAVARGVGKTYSDDYGPLAALPPTILSLFSGYPTALRYLIAITLIYVLPAYIMVAYLGNQLCGGRSQNSYSQNFRRWYVFASVGIVLSSVMIASIQLWMRRKDWREIVRRALLAVILISFAAIPLLAPVLFDWSRDLGQHNYAKLYAPERRSFVNEAINFVNNYGVVFPILSIISIIVLYRLNRNRQLLFLLVASSICAAFLFLQVQGPSQHHFYLLMPFFGASIAGLCVILYRRYGWAAPCGFSALILLGGVITTNSPQSSFGTFFVSCRDWLPKQQPYARCLKEIGEWLVAPEIKDKKFIFMRSPEISGGMIAELWQLVPAVPKTVLRDRFIMLDGLGNRNEAVHEKINKCNIALISTHLKERDPISGKIFQQDLMTGSGLGAAFERTSVVFPIDENTKFLVYQRMRNVSRQEYLDFAERCLALERPHNIKLRGY